MGRIGSGYGFNQIIVPLPLALPHLPVFLGAVWASCLVFDRWLRTVLAKPEGLSMLALCRGAGPS